jgi:tetratricopeptide (TPR) repeat protein
MAALVLMVSPKITGQTTSPPYLSQFPSVERVKGEITGLDATDTAARQSAAFWWLNQIAMAVGGSGKLVSSSESGLLYSRYIDAFRSYAQIHASGRNPRWEQLLETYKYDPVFGDELLKRFFTPDFRAGYYKFSGKQPPQSSSQPTTGSIPPSTSKPGTAGGGRLYYDAAGNWKYQDQWGGVYDKNGYTWADGSLTTNSGIKVKADQPGIVDNGDGTKTDLRKEVGHPVTLQEARQFAINLEEDLQSMGYSQPNTAQAIIAKIENRPSGQSDPTPRPSVSGNTTKPSASATTKPTNSNPANRTNTPRNGSAKDYFDQGKKYYEAKDYAKAVEAFKKSIALEPSAERYKTLALSYIKLNQYPEAVAAIQQAIRLASNDYQNHQLLGICFIRMGQYEKAIVPLNEAIPLKPNETDAPYVHNHLGIAYYFLERFPEAATAFQQAVRLTPNNAEFLNNLGSTCIYLRRRADALQIYEKLQKIDQAKAKELKDDIDIYLKDTDAEDLAGALFFLGSYSLENNDYSGASKAFYHAMALKQLAPKQLGEAHNGRGKAFVGLKRYDMAIAEFREAIRLDPKNAEYHLAFGKAYLAAGQKVQAQQVYQKLLTLNRLRAQELLTEINKLK